GAGAHALRRSAAPGALRGARLGSAPGRVDVSGRRLIDHRNAIAPTPTARIAAVARTTGRDSAAAPSAATIPHLTTVFASVAMTIAFRATSASPALAYSAIDSVIASTSVRPARPATM